MKSPGIFRKVALDRMSSPEQLDQLLHITSPHNWFALVAVAAVLGVALAWGYAGQLTTKVFGEGVLIRAGGVRNVVPLGSGQVMDLRVRVGDHVAAGEVIATVAKPELLERIRIAKSRLADAVTQKEEVFKVRSDKSRLQLEFVKRQRANLEREIQELREQVAIVERQVPVDEELLAKGLITKQQVYLTQQKLVGLKGDIASRQAQITQLDSVAFQTEKESLEANLDNENKITDLKRELGILEMQLTTESRVVTPYAGEVLEVKVSPGALVQVGTPVISLHPDVQKLEALIYVPVARAKEVRAGMDAEISPTIVRREEYGFIRGKVAAVSDYPVTEEALMRIFENGPLVKSLGAGGPVTEIRVQMAPDPSTPSGYRWSSAKGAPVKLSGGTVCTGEIVTRRQKPVSMVFPYLKEKAGVR